MFLPVKNKFIFAKLTGNKTKQMDFKPARFGCAILGLRAQLHAHPAAPGCDKDVALAGCHPRWVPLGQGKETGKRLGSILDAQTPPFPCSPSSQGCFSAIRIILDNFPFLMS